MDIIHYQKVLLNDSDRAYLAKLYGLELLFISRQCELDLAENDIEDSYELLSYLNPRRVAFSSHIQVFEAAGHIINTESSRKSGI